MLYTIISERYQQSFLVLHEIFREGLNVEGMQDECWELFTIAFRPNYWMKYESPLVLYKNIKDSSPPRGWLADL